MTGQTEIAFNVPEYSGAEIAHVRKSLASGHTSSNHEFSQKAREILQAETGAAAAMAAVADGTVTVEPELVGLDGVVGAHRRLEGRRTVGKLVVDLDRARDGAPHPVGSTAGAGAPLWR